MEADDAVVTGTSGKYYNLLWYVESCLRHALKLETFIQDAIQSGDKELAHFFTVAQADARNGAELGKGLLRARLGIHPSSAAGAGGLGASGHDRLRPGQGGAQALIAASRNRDAASHVIHAAYATGQNGIYSPQASRRCLAASSCSPSSAPSAQPGP